MKKVLIAIMTFISLSAFIEPITWKSDKAHSKLAFTVTHLGISDVSGLFRNFDVKISSASKDFSDAVIEMTADVSSIDTEIEMRDNHLRSADFFDVAKYPRLSFKSTSIRKTGKNKYKLTGDLSLHGITKTVTMDLLYRGTIENPMSKAPTAGFQVLGTIKRSDFGIGAGFPPSMISDEVRIKADGEFAK